LTFSLKSGKIWEILENYGRLWQERRKLLGFCGKFTCSIDDKGRISIPAKVRPSDPDSSRRRGIPAGEEMVLTEGLDGCLCLYTLQGWEEYKTLIKAQMTTQSKIRYFNRRMYQHTSLVRIDRSGRILIPDHLRKLAGLQKTAMVVGVEEIIEIWDPERYQTYLDNFDQTFEEVAEEFHRDE
jgi:MraZ protein